MNAFKVLSTMFILATTSVIALCQNVSFKAEANRKTLSVGETLQVGFFIEADAMDYSIDKPMRFPDHPGFRLVGENKTQNIQYVNGKGVIQDGIILIFNPEKEGKLKIGSAKIEINGKLYTTKPIEIEVTKSNTTSVHNKSVQNQPVFLQTNVSKTDPYVNEQVSLIVKYYSRDLGLLNRKRNFRQGKLEGLSPKMVTSRPETIKQEMVSGKPYFSEEVAKYNLFPQKAGRIEIDPFSMDILVSGIYGTEAYEIKSNPIIINAKALPEEGKPANFSGAVGDFKLVSAVDKKELNTNESSNLKIKISGKGNFNTVIIPEIKKPKNLEIYPPNKTNNFKNYEDGMQGSVSADIVMVPEYGGNYTIAPVEFSYFDPEKEKYITLKSDEVNISVDGTTSDTVNGASNSLAYQGHDEAVNKESLSDSVAQITNEVTHGNSKWILTAGGLLVMSMVGLFLLRRKKEDENVEILSSNEVKNSEDNYVTKPYTNQKMSSYSEKINVSTESKKDLNNKLSDLQKNINNADPKVFYKFQEDLLCQLGMKYSGTDLANFSDYSVGEKLIQNGWDNSLVNEWKTLLNKARQAKYSAIGSYNDDLTEVYLQTEKVVNQFIK